MEGGARLTKAEWEGMGVKGISERGRIQETNERVMLNMVGEETVAMNGGK